MLYEEYLKQKRPYQEFGHLFLLEQKHACLFYKPGKGKTYPTIDAIRDIDASMNGNSKVLILSTADAIKNMWNAEIVPQNILPKNTVLMSFNSAIVDKTKSELSKIKWDTIVVDECMPPWVEILTDRGYRRFDELSKTEKIAQYTDDGKIEFVDALEYIKKPFNGELYELNYKNGKCLPMTPNHVQPFILNGKIVEHYASEEYNSTKSSLIFAGEGTGDENVLSTLDKLAIAMQADGSICPTSKKDYSNGLIRWSVNLRRNRKITLLNQYLEELNIESKFWKNGAVQTFLLPKNITKFLKDSFDFSKFSKNKAEEFINEIIKWDGYENENNIDYKSIEKDNADFVCAVATLAGYCSHITEINDDRFKNSKTQYRVSITKQAIRNCQSKNWTKRRYIGNVYCVKVPSKKIIVRSDGYTLVTGNCHKIKSHNSKTSKLVYQLSKKAPYTFGLTGTPRGNSDIDIYCQFHNMNISEWGSISYTQFVELCCDVEPQFFRGNCIKVPTGINKKYQVGWERNIAQYSQRVDYTDDDNMPELEVNVVELPYKESKEYRDAMDGVIQLSNYETTMTKLVAIMKAHQIVNGFLYYDDEDGKRKVHLIANNSKLDWLRENLKSNNVIVYRYDWDRQEILKMLENEGYTVTEIVEEFKRGNAEILLLQCSRCESFNLQTCNRIIFYTLDYSYIKYNQMLHRIWRMGQKEQCEIVVLTFKNTVDEDIWLTVKNKEVLADLFMRIKGV